MRSRILRSNLVASLIALGLVLSTAATSWGKDPKSATTSVHAVSCEALFAAVDRRASLFEKFGFKSDGQGVDFLNHLFIRGFRGETRITVLTKSLSPEEGKAALAFFSDLINQGLLVDFSMADNGRHPIVFQGPPDLMIAALRHSSVETIRFVEPIDSKTQSRTPITKVVPETNPSEWPANFRSRFELKEDFFDFLHYVMNTRADMHHVIVKASGLNRSSGDDRQFIADIRKLGIRVDFDSLRGKGRLISLIGPIEAIVRLIGHPAIVEVVRFDGGRSPEVRRRERKEAQIRERSIVRALGSSAAPKQFAIEGESATEGAVSVFRDPDTYPLLRVGSRGRPEKTIRHEAATARAYALYLEQYRGEELVYMSFFEGKTVPVFDGISVSRDTVEPVANISFKSIGRPVESRSHERFIEVVTGSLNNHLDREKKINTPTDWVRASNSVRTETMLLDSAQHMRHLAHTRALLNLFALFPEVGVPFKRREVRVVIDMSQSGLPFRLAHDESVKTALSKYLSLNAPHPTTLVLLWDQHSVVEISRER